MCEKRNGKCMRKGIGKVCEKEYETYAKWNRSCMRKRNRTCMRKRNRKCMRKGME